MKTLEQILEQTKKAPRGGDFGLDACIESVERQASYEEQERTKKGRDEILYDLLRLYVHKANYDPFFNDVMVRGVWEVINGRGYQK